MNKTKAKTRTRQKQGTTRTRTRTKKAGNDGQKHNTEHEKIYKHVCLTQFSEARTNARTRTLGLSRVDGKAAVATAAHERPMLGAGDTRFR